MQETLSIGVDLGGTKTEAVVLRRRATGASAGEGPAFEVVTRRREPTPQSDGYDAVLAATAGLIRAVSSEAGVALDATRVGVGMPGAVSRRTGLVKNSNTVCLNGRPFREELGAALGCAVEFENDANCFALAETRLGAARAHQAGVVFGVILGTGVGGGLVLHGSIWPGPQHLGGEWGHHAVGPWRRSGDSVRPLAGRDLGLALSERELCYCGQSGCLELYASGRAVERDYARRSGTARSLAEIAVRRGTDADAAAAIDEMLEALGRALANLIDMLDPSAIVLGGGASNLDLLYTEGVDRVARYVFNDELITPIVRHELGDSAGVLGAALL